MKPISDEAANQGCEVLSDWLRHFPNGDGGKMDDCVRTIYFAVHNAMFTEETKISLRPFKEYLPADPDFQSGR